MKIWRYSPGQFEHLKYHFKVGIEGQVLTGCTYWELSSPFDAEICDQLWILDRVHQKYPNKIFFKLLFWLCGCLELLNRKARAIRDHIKEDLGGQDTLT